jgi:N-acetylneuraminic acid mutarotase
MLRFFLIYFFVALSGTAFAQGWGEGRPMDTARAALAVAEMDGKIYAIGGAGRLAPMSVAERYDPAAGGWRSIPDLPVGLEQFGLAALDGKLYAVGGYPADGNGAHGAEAWAFDEESGEWVPVSPLPDPRAAFSLVAANGKLYAIGGSGDNADKMAIYDPALNAWRSEEGGPAARRASVALFLNDKIYYIAGGTASAPSGQMDIYHIATKSWSRGPELPTARSGHAAAVFGGKIHIMGGRGGGRGETLKDHWIFDPNAGSWSQGHDLSTPRTGGGAAAVGASVYLIGGGSGGGFYASFTSMNSVEVLRFLPEF